MAAATIDVTINPVLLKAPHTLDEYLDRVDVLVGEAGKFKPTAASELEGLLNDAFCGYIGEKLSMDELDELQQYVRAHGYIADWRITVSGFRVEWPGYATGGMLKTPPTYAFMGGMLA